MHAFPKFLVVDDVAENRFLLAKTLLRKFPSATIQKCQESAPAIALARDENPTAIVVHRSADVDGVSLIGLLREANRNVPIIMVSGRETCPGALEAGANTFLNYDAWLRIGTVVEETLVQGRLHLRAGSNPSIAARENDGSPVGA